jgi:hypothetical protein
MLTLLLTAMCIRVSSEYFSFMAEGNPCFFSESMRFLKLVVG